MTKPALMVGLGEILWDLLPSGKVLGGAPTNFAYMASVLGESGVVASRVGTDSLGREVHRQLEQLRLSTEYLQEDAQYRTGTAAVAIDAAGQPTFTIGEPVAWDRLEWTPAWSKLSMEADVICFGSLAQRASASAGTIQSFLENAGPDALKIFDVNLRQSYYGREVLDRSLQQANIVKLSDHELLSVATILSLEGSSEELLARQLLQQFQLKLVCVTRGARGSLLVSEKETVGHPGFAVKVVDAVGAGDAFTACLAHQLVRRRSFSEISEYANRFASWVATQIGATPMINRPQVKELFR
jgi:fructokinase